MADDHGWNELDVLKAQLAKMESEMTKVKSELAISKAKEQVQPTLWTDMLGAELAKAKSELAVYKVKARTPLTPKVDGEYFRFLDLPRELRDAIYELCVVPGKVYIATPSSSRRYDMRVRMKPQGKRHKKNQKMFNGIQTQLFRINKQVGSEAKEIYLSKNLFLLLPGPHPNPEMARLDCLKYIFSNSEEKQLLRRLSISLDYRDFKGTTTDVLVQSYRPAIDPTMPHAGFHSARHLRACIHRRTRLELVQEWKMLLAELAGTKLDYLQISVENCYCAQGCHRLVEDMTQEEPSPHLGHDIFFISPKIVDIIGTVTQNEVDRIREAVASVGRDASSEDKFDTEIQFHGKRRFQQLPSGEYISAAWDRDFDLLEDGGHSDEQLRPWLHPFKDLRRPLPFRAIDLQY